MFNIRFLKKMINAYEMDLETARIKIGLSRPISDFETESPSYEEIEKIADFFNITTDALFGRTNAKRRDDIVNSLKYDIEYPYNMLEQVLGKPIDWQLKDENAEGLEWALSKINERHANILLKYFKEGMTFEQIGEDMGVTKERVRQIVATGLRSLRHPMKLKAIFKGLHSFEEVDEYFASEKNKLNERTKELGAREKALEERELALEKKSDISCYSENDLPEDKPEPKPEVSEVPEDDGFLLEDLELNVRVLQILKSAGLTTLNEVISKIKEDPEGFISIPNLGKRLCLETVQALDEFLCTNQFEEIIEDAYQNRSDNNASIL